uniref:Uncharacterized protein n=1 Tax=Anguilla anguilla TaxID=7936 RepID=A0A0E9QR64_ANGAN
MINTTEMSDTKRQLAQTGLIIFLWFKSGSWPIIMLKKDLGISAFLERSVFISVIFAYFFPVVKNINSI